MLKKSIIALSLLSLPALAASFNVTGNARFGTNLFNNLDVSPGLRSGAGDTTGFIEHRVLLRPDVVVDDRFTLRSELVLAPSLTLNDQPGQMGTLLGNGSVLALSRSWIDWASDWGIFSVGRMPKQWGLGLLYNAGTNVYDDYGTTRDRVGFKALLGNMGLNMAYEKGREGVATISGDDIESYEISIDYSNSESLFDVGLLYTRDIVMIGAPSARRSAHNLSIYTRKRWDRLQLGGEFVNIPEAGGVTRTGALAQIDYMPGALEFGLDIGFASGNSSNKPFMFHSNYRPFLILFNHTLGTSQPLSTLRGGAAGQSSVGSAVGIGDGNGAFLTKLSVSYGFDNKNLRLGTNLGWANLIRKGTNAGTSLGLETDIHLNQKWYDNFNTSYALGMLFPGSGFGTSSQVAWGLQIRGALSF